MLKKTITYTDFNGNPRTEDLYFNLSAPELMQFELLYPEGIQKELERIHAENDKSALFTMFERIILSSYGVKSADGRSFVKNPQVVQDFRETAAYPALFAELAFDDGAFDAFVDGIMPKDLLDKLNARAKAGEMIQ